MIDFLFFKQQQLPSLYIMSKFYINTAPKSTSIFTETELPKDTAIGLEPRLKNRFMRENLKKRG